MSAFETASAIIGGMRFADAVSLPQQDPRFTYGAARGEDGMVDLNFGNVLITVVDDDGWAMVSPMYQEYDDDGNFIADKAMDS